MVNKAINLAKQGFKVFPITPGKKFPPCIKDHLNLATTEEVQITNWWTQWPKANIGIVPAPNYLVLDIDLHKPGSKESFQKLVNLGIKPTYTVETYRKGLHLYHVHPGGGVFKAVAGVLPGVDLRADGSYVVAPGSIIGGVEYKVIRDIPLTYLPLEVVNLLPYKSKYIDKMTLSPTDTSLAGSRDYSKPPVSVPVGERDGYAYALACSLEGRGFTRETAAVEAKKHWAKFDQPDKHTFTWAEFEEKLDRVFAQYGKEVPLTTLQKLLKRYAFIVNGSYVVDLDSHHKTSVLKLPDWRNSMRNKGKLGDVKTGKFISAAWLEDTRRLTYHDQTYYPNSERIITRFGKRFYNKYIPSELSCKSHLVFDAALLNIFTEHIDYLFEGNAFNKDYFIKWLAFTVQKLPTRIPWAPVIISSYHGVGKGWLFQLLQQLCGIENCCHIEPQALSESNANFNEWWGRKLLWLDELNPKYQFYEKLKGLITEIFGTINEKYGTKEHRRIFCNVIATSNHGDALQIPEHDRRLWIVRHDTKPYSPEYYIQLFNWLETDGPQALYNYLMRYDLSEFQHAAPPPLTEAKIRMIESGRSEFEISIRSAFELNKGAFKYDIVSYDQAYHYVSGALETTLTLQDKKSVGNALNRISNRTLPQRSYTIKVGGDTRSTRVALIRNEVKWCNATKEEITEYLQTVMKDIK